MKIMESAAAALLALYCVAATAAVAVREPPPSARKITLVLMHPNASPQVVLRKDVTKATVADIRLLLRQRLGTFQDAALECDGGYNPVLPTDGVNLLDFSIYNGRAGGQTPLFAQLDNSASAHQACMARALDFASHHP